MPRLVLQPSRTGAGEEDSRHLRLRHHPAGAQPPGAAAGCSQRLEQRRAFRAKAITILIATGLHRPATEAEIVEILGPEIAARLPCGAITTRGELSEHRSLGVTASGTPVSISTSDSFRPTSTSPAVSLSRILMLGYSGGRKLIVPGLAAQETIKVLHSPKFMRDPRAVEGSIEDNPLHRELLEIARMARHDFMVDVALARDRRIAGVFAGDPVEAHRRGVEFVSRVMLEMLEEPVDAVITTSAGYPLDSDLLPGHQGHHRRFAHREARRQDPAAGGLRGRRRSAGIPAHARDFPPGEQFLDDIDAAPVEIDQWQLEKLALVTRKAEVLFYVPGLSAEYYPHLWGTASPLPPPASRPWRAPSPPVPPSPLSPRARTSWPSAAAHSLSGKSYSSFQPLACLPPAICCPG